MTKLSGEFLSWFCIPRDVTTQEEFGCLINNFMERTGNIANLVQVDLLLVQNLDDSSFTNSVVYGDSIATSQPMSIKEIAHDGTAFVDSCVDIDH